MVRLQLKSFVLISGNCTISLKQATWELYSECVQAMVPPMDTCRIGQQVLVPFWHQYLLSV